MPATDHLRCYYIMMNNKPFKQGVGENSKEIDRRISLVINAGHQIIHLTFSLQDIYTT